MPTTPPIRLHNSQLVSHGLATYSLAGTGTGTKLGTVFIVPKAGNIRYIGHSYNAVSSPTTTDARLETVTASTGAPTGSLWAANTNATFTPATGSYIWTQMTADAAVTAGQEIAAVITYGAGGTGTATINRNHFLAESLLPFHLPHNGTSWSTGSSSTMPCVAIKYDDGTIVPGSYLAYSQAAANYKSSTNPNERATVFVPPVGLTCIGVEMGVQNTSGTNNSFSVNLYSGTSTTALATATIPALTPGQQFSQRTYRFDFPAGVELTAGQQYRLGALQLGSTGNDYLEINFTTTADRDATIGPFWTDTRNGAAWIGENTTKTQLIFPIFGGVSTGGGGRVQSLTRGLIE